MPPQTSSTGSLDPQVVALAKAVRDEESGGNPTAHGKSGEYGAYQYIPGTWAKQSAEAGVNVPLEQASMSDQNKVWYTWAKSKKDQGYTPGQIISMQNAGEGEPDAYTGKFSNGSPSKGVNPEGVAFDVPDYAKNVAQKYQQYKNESKPLASENVAASESSSLIPDVGAAGSELVNNIASRFQQGSDSVSQSIEGLAQGNLHKAASGLLQTAGAAAGGVGDVVNAGLELVPGVQAAEKGVSGLVHEAAQTKMGQDIAQKLSDFTQAHPELSGDIQAGINIASVVPMFKGLSLLKGGITDAAGQALRGNLESAAQEEMRNAVGSKVSSSVAAAEKRGLDPLGHITSTPENIPAIEEDASGAYKYNSEKAIQNIQGTLSRDEENLQNMLDQGVKKNIMVNLDEARAQMLKDVVKDFPVSAKAGQGIRAVNEFFDNVAPSTGGRNYISLNELNGLKRDIGGGVNWMNLGAKNGELKSSMYRSLMGQVEKGASKAGVNGIKEINKVMGEKIEALKVLGQLSGKTVKQSKIGKIIREIGSDVSGGAAELAGNQAGIPFASTLAGRGLFQMVPGRVPLTATRLLGRNGRGTIQSSLRKGILKSAKGQALRGLVAPRQQ